MADVSVRPARPDDAGEIGRIQVETWRTGYAKILPASVLDSLDAGGAAEVWASAISSPPTLRHHVLVALEGQWLVGFVAFGPAEVEEQALDTTDAPAPDAAADPAGAVSLAALLVEPRWGRRGHGSRLLSALVDHARRDGATLARIWIPESDDVTRAFLESAGWAPDGLVRALDTGAGELREIRLHTELSE